MKLARDEILERLRMDLIGPMSIDEEFTDYPTDVYLTGILFPQRTIIAPEDEEQLSAEGGTKKADGGDTSEDEIAHSSMQRPPSFGVSFAVKDETEAPKVNLSFTAARYELIEVEENPESPEPNSETETEGEQAGTEQTFEAEDDPRLSDTNRSSAEIESESESDEPGAKQTHIWKRTPVSLVLSDLPLRLGATDYASDVHEVDGIRIHIRCAPWNDVVMVTAMAINTFETEKGQTRFETEATTFFQTLLTVECPNSSTHFHRRPVGWSAADEDSRSARLIYRNAAEYSVGHTSSSAWVENEEGAVTAVKAEWMPVTKVPAYSSLGDKILADCANGESNPYSAKWLSGASGDALTQGLKLLPAAYLKWLDTQKDKLGSLDGDMKTRALEHFTAAETVAGRMSEAIDFLNSNPRAMVAFRLANAAILTQFQWSTETSGDIVWRPFQLGFMLLSLPSIINRNHPDRLTADLLWFPTGGGKTEAYLGLIAFCLFYRRLVDGDAGAGVSAIMRYTLRLLTIQQFQRATNLICACERIRLGEFRPDDLGADLGTRPFSIGLWVGAASVPNTIAEATKALREPGPSTPKQLTHCPCEKKTLLNWSREENPDSIKVRCTGSGCVWSQENSNLPVWTVDEDVYRERPSLLIGTIDKFAQIARKDSTGAFFGLGTRNLPPDLIIQDELHLISGPLGTIAGLYECAIDELCEHEGVKPKIIASTATIREASAQIRALFARETCLFPPPVVDADNSGFAVVDRNQPGRLYTGLTTAGRSAKFSLQATAASLLQSAYTNFDEHEPGTDWYTTLVTYFNSLRELGGALVLMQDDVYRTIAQISGRRKEDPREIYEIEELTSRVESSEVREILDRLEEKFGSDDCIDVLLASNMLSVGVDVSRFGLMVVNGQPKGMAEYIQSTSRVGRGKVPGLIVSIYNDAKVRDRSHFETFRTWHESLYRDVEATSVTPFSSRARDRALHAVLVILARYLINTKHANPSFDQSERTAFNQLCEKIVRRTSQIDSAEVQNVSDELQDIIDQWSVRYGLRSYWNDYNQNTSLLVSAEKAAQQRALGRARGAAWPTPNSMRNVEPSTQFELIEFLRRDQA